jgi:hypothetical protein
MLRLIHRVSLSWAFFCVTLSLSAQTSSLIADGIVAGIKGKWIRVKDKKILEVGDEIFPGTTVRAERPAVSSIKIALFDGRVWAKDCAKEQCDTGSYPVPSIPPGDRGFATFVATYPTARKRVSSIFTAARSFGAAGPQEAVLVVDSGVVDLSAAVSDVKTGRLRVTLSDPSKSRDSGTKSLLNWPAETKFALPNSILNVYALDLETESGDPIGTPAAILVADSRSGPAAQAEFSKAKAMASRWQGVEAATIRSFLVQALYAIAAENKR